MIAPRSLKFIDASDQAEHVPGTLLEAGVTEHLITASEDVSASR